MATLKSGGPLGASREEQAMSRQSGFHLLPSFHHHPLQHNYTTQTVTHGPTVTLTSLLQHYTDTIPTRNVVCLRGA